MADRRRVPPAGAGDRLVRLLLVEDEERVASFIAKGMEGAGFVTDITRTGKVAMPRK